MLPKLRPLCHLHPDDAWGTFQKQGTMASRAGLSHVLARHVVCLSNYKLGKALTLFTHFTTPLCLCQRMMKIICYNLF